MGDLWYTAQQPQIVFPAIYMMSRHAHVHVSVVLDEAQWSSGGMQTRTLLRGSSGLVWMSMPIAGGTSQRPLREMQLGENWKKILYNKVRGVYGGSPCFREGMDVVEWVLGKTGDKTSVPEMAHTMLYCLRDLLNLQFRIVHSLNILPGRPKEPCQWICNLGVALGATDYVQGQMAIRGYFVPGTFSRAGIRLWGQDFTCPQYKGRHGVYSSDLSILDSIMMIGVSASRALLGTTFDPVEFCEWMEGME